jgi:hypothetical protein
MANVKMEDFWCKAHFVAGGHTIYTPHAMNYASAVLRETIIIALTLSDLNGLDVKMAGIENVYLKVPVTEKVWTVLGPEFGDGAQSVQSLYGLYIV